MTDAGTGQGSDPELWDRLKDGDEAALSALFYRHSDAVYNFAFRRTFSWEIAEEAVQATFATLWRRCRSRRMDSLRLDSARPVLFVMAAHECSNLARSSRRHLALVDKVAGRDEHVVDPADSVAERVDDERVVSKARRALARLPVKQRDVVELVIWGNCSMAEAAAALGVPEGTVKSRLARARAQLADLIDPESQQRNSS